MQRQDINEALRTVERRLEQGEPLPQDPELSRLLGTAMRMLREMHVGPDTWAKGWLSAEMAFGDFARKFNELTQ
ncbi:hypothetical protein HUO13_12000 [Saccharopolyspora erythraea]|uniref:hypothetical protein n=1 Tax=Saccharopolyspora erythraea TaxID=1836 RepID=UPI001BAD21D0|nr:hypothetical protein [Saccharopolyspora erythraea]QUH01436.1 hypothetical protein HUO13_12000 [Saccharopolyspora erythraea]